jgi:hypothetical protein
MLTIKERLNRTNGWQRIYLAIALIGVVIALGNIYYSISHGTLGQDLLEIVWALTVSLALLYFVGWMVAWIRKGFNKK